jgi:hypothetical protein
MILSCSSWISLQGRQIVWSAGVSTRSIRRHGVRWRRGGGSAEGWGCGRGPSAFFEEGTHAAGAPREPAVNDTCRAISWTPGLHERWRRRPGPADAPAFPSGSTARQAPGKDARQVEASAGCRAYTAGKVSAEDSAILTVAEACDGTTAGLAARRTRGVACNQIRGEPNVGFFVDFVAGAADHVVGRVGTQSSLRHWASWRRGGGSAEGWGCGRGPSAFFEVLREAPMPPERPGSQPSTTPVARSRGLPDRTKGGGNVPVQRTHRRLLPAQRPSRLRKRRAAGGGVFFLRIHRPCASGTAASAITPPDAPCGRRPGEAASVRPRAAPPPARPAPPPWARRTARPASAPP